MDTLKKKKNAVVMVYVLLPIGSTIQKHLDKIQYKGK